MYLFCSFFKPTTTSTTQPTTSTYSSTTLSSLQNDVTQNNGCNMRDIAQTARIRNQSAGVMQDWSNMCSMAHVEVYCGRGI